MGQALPCSTSQKLGELPACLPELPLTRVLARALGFKQHRGSDSLVALAQVDSKDQPEPHTQVGNTLPQTKL